MGKWIVMIYTRMILYITVSHCWLTSPMEESVHTSYDWRPSYIKASQQALDIFQMARYTRNWTCIVTECTSDPKNQIMMYWLGVGWFKWNRGDFNPMVWNPDCDWLSLFNLLIWLKMHENCECCQSKRGEKTLSTLRFLSVLWLHRLRQATMRWWVFGQLVDIHFLYFPLASPKKWYPP